MTNLEKVLFSGEELNVHKLSEILGVDDIFISTYINSKAESLTHGELKNILLVMILSSYITGDIALSIDRYTSYIIPGYGKTASELVKQGQVMLLIEYLGDQITVGTYA